MAVNMRIPTRDPAQLAKDKVRTRDQVQKLRMPDAALVASLRARHSQEPGALKFETAGRQRGGDALVVSRQLVVAAGVGRDEAHVELTSKRGFARHRLAENDPRSAASDDRVWVYSVDAGDRPKLLATIKGVWARIDSLLRRGRADKVDKAVRALDAMGVVAARTMVTALHMVIKSEGGPAPTTVTVAPFPAQGAPTVNQIRIAVIDTGIDEPLRGDGWLNEVVRDANDDNVDALDALPQNGKLDFGAGHGTFVAGVIRQVDPQAEVVVYRALDSDGLASEADVADVMLRAAQEGAHIINISFGMQAVDDSSACPALRHAVAQIQAGGPNAPVIVASAGNYGTDERVYPAALPGVVSVAALEAAAAPGSGPVPNPPQGAAWSSRGSWVRCSAVGEGIVSTFVTGVEDPYYDGGTDVYPQDAWAVWSGTSFAAPQIAAYIAETCRTQNLAPKAAVAALFPTGGLPADGFGTRVVLLPGTQP